jgi:HNH endonuclease
MNKKKRGRIQQRADFLCEYCLSPQKYASGYYEADHVQPSSKEGSDDFENYANACNGCNNLKSNATHAIDPQTGESVPLYNPRKDNWHDHFQWDETKTLMQGLSPTGRATIEKLQLNREGVVNLRTILVLLGLHP